MQEEGDLPPAYAGPSPALSGWDDRPTRTRTRGRVCSDAWRPGETGGDTDAMRSVRRFCLLFELVVPHARHESVTRRVSASRVDLSARRTR
jgi:hypothetical protein